MFSDMPRKHYDEELAHHREGLLDIIQRAGINVLWNDNDGGCKGACDRVPHQNVTELNLPGQCIDGECYDEVLFHGLEDYIDHLKGDGVIVLHTIGSHGPTYYNRYPPQFKKFTPTCDTNEIQNCSQQQLINTYDNTVLYVDYIVDKAINLLKSHQINSPPARSIFPITANHWVKMAFIYTVCRIPLRRIRKNMSRCSFGFLKIINSVIRWIRPACKNGRARWIIHRTIFSQPCWD